MRCSLVALVFLGLLTAVYAQDTTLTVKDADGQPALVLKVPNDAKFSTIKEMTEVHNKTLWLHLWLAPKAKTVEEALPLVAEVIKGEFIDTKVVSTEAVTVAGTAGKLVTLKGKEADDQDPGTAYVVVFAIGKQAFIGCVHGEDDDAATEKPGMMKVLDTAKAP